MIGVIGALVGAADRAQELVRGYEARLAAAAADARGRRAAKVYFEVWDNPITSGVRWVSELIGIAGGQDVFPSLWEKVPRDRAVSSEAVVAAAPDLILVCWCGRKVFLDRVRQRPGWDTIPAVRSGHIVELKAPWVAQPGPATLTDGLDAIVAVMRRLG